MEDKYTIKTIVIYRQCYCWPINSRIFALDKWKFPWVAPSKSMITKIH